MGQEQIAAETGHAKKPSRWRERVIAAFVGVVVLAVVCVAGFWQRDLVVGWRMKPWQKSEYQGLMDRLHRSAVDKDLKALQTCVDPQLITVQENGGSPALELGSMMRRTVAVKDVSERGPYRLERITLQQGGEGTALVHAQDKENTLVVFLMSRGADGQLKIAHVGLEAMGLEN